MNIRIWEEPARFRDYVEPYLLPREAEHNLLFGILHTLAHQPERYRHAPLLMTAEDDNGEIRGMGLMTPPHNLVLSRLEGEEVASRIAEELHRRGAKVPGVLGPAEECDRFVRAWERLTGQQATLARRQRTYRLEKVAPFTEAPGSMRPAAEADHPLARQWALAFADEALDGEAEQRDALNSMNLFLSLGGLYLWEDGEGQVVSMAGVHGLTPHGIRVSYVYTPPEQRGRGYASTLVARLSRKMLDEGRTFCFLFADLDNPTANHIYQTIGYEPVGDMVSYDFTRSPGAEP